MPKNYNQNRTRRFRITKTKLKLTRLPSNLRPTSGECMHLVTRSHFRSRDEDGDHTIRSAISKNPRLHANFTALCVVETKLLPIEVLRCEH